MSRLINRNIKLRLAFSTEESGLFEGRERRTGFEGKIAKKTPKGFFFQFDILNFTLFYLHIHELIFNI